MIQKKKLLPFNKRQKTQKPAKLAKFAKRKRTNRGSTVVLRQARNGAWRMPLPEVACTRLGLRLNQRVWVVLDERKGQLTVSPKPYGPYPMGRRTTTRLIRNRVGKRRGGL